MTTGSAAGDIPVAARRGSSGYSTADAAADSGMGGGSYVPPSAPLDKAPARRSLLGQALYDTFGRTGARVAAVWIGLVAVLGVFAPFLANSHPILLRSADGRLSSPMIGSLGPVDVSIVVYFAFAVWVVLRKGMTATQRVAALLWPVLVVTAVVLAADLGVRLLTFRIYRPPWLADAAGVAGFTGSVWVFIVNLGALLVAALVAVALVVYSVRFIQQAGSDPVLVG